jgi:hypothetical protein
MDHAKGAMDSMASTAQPEVTHLFITRFRLLTSPLRQSQKSMGQKATDAVSGNRFVLFAWHCRFSDFS